MVNSQASFGAFEAKTHFSDLLDRVERGERLVITRHGRSVAVLAPFRAAALQDVAAIVDRAVASTKGTSLPKGKTIKDLINAGRKR
jgi:prevent-host-death family protein